MRTLFRYALLGLVLVLVALVSALTAMRLAIHGSEVSVPKLVGMTPGEAEREALDYGLLVEVQNRFYSANVTEGRILSQAPQPGTRVRRGWRVRVAESLGPQRVTIPNVVGQSARAAELNLRRRGLELGTVAVAHLPDAPPEQVVAQSPPPNASGISSPRIDLLVTAPAEEAQFVMPDLTGRSLGEAVKAVEAAGLKVASMKSVRVAPAPAPGAGNTGPPNASAATNAASGAAATAVVKSGTVIRQTPAAGQRIAQGTPVSFEVAQ